MSSSYDVGFTYGLPRSLSLVCGFGACVFRILQGFYDKASLWVLEKLRLSGLHKAFMWLPYRVYSGPSVSDAP